VLKFNSGLIRHPVASAFLGPAQAEIAQNPRQCGVLDLDAFFFHQFLVHPLDPPVTFPVKPLEKIRINPDLVSTG
jgi:hypothetical protein